jgi:hypothetical protein
MTEDGQDNKQLSPQEAAACVVAMLEARGARFRLSENGFFNVSLDDVVPALTPEKAEVFATVILALREEIRAELWQRAVVH